MRSAAFLLLVSGFLTPLHSAHAVPQAPAGPIEELSPAEPTPPPAPPSKNASVEDLLRRGKNEYAYGEYALAVDTLRSLLYPMRLYSDELVIETRRYLGLALYLLDRKNEARTEFLKLLFLDPDYELDPFTVAPPIVDLFEAVRRDHRTELDMVRERKVEKELNRDVDAGVRRTVTVNVLERSEVATFLPFGVGQFVNGDIAWGVTFALLQVACLAVNVGSFIYLRALERTYPPERADLVQNLIIAQFVGAGLFGVAWSAGVFHARFNFVPTETRRSVTEDRIEPGSTRLGAQVSLGWDF